MIGKLILLAALEAALSSLGAGQSVTNENILCYAADPKTENIRLYWKDGAGKKIGNLRTLKRLTEDRGENLVFATNGGMFKQDRSPQGLFIQNQKQLAPLDTSSGEGNFYLKPNGIFFITVDGRPDVVRTERFRDDGAIAFATQSGPMLLADGKILPGFSKTSKNLNIRNGVCVAPDGNALFAMSKVKINFYEFAAFFQKSGCKDALYLDGFVSRTYLPESKWEQPDGELGVLIGVTRNNPGQN